MNRQHPLKIAAYFFKNLWILLFPAVKAIYSAKDWTGIWQILKNHRFSLILAAALLTWGFLRWRLTVFTVSSDNITFTGGVVIRKKTVIPYSKIAAVSVRETLGLRMIKAAEISFFTVSPAKPALRLLVSRRVLSGIRTEFQPLQKGGIKYQFKPNFSAMLFFSLIFSSSLSGALYLAAFLVQSGNIIQDIIDKNWLETWGEITEEMTGILQLNIHPIASGIAIAVVLTWLISFIRNTFRYSAFQIEKGKNSIKVKSGIFQKNSFRITPEKINYTDLSQNLLMKLFGVVSLQVNAPGYNPKSTEFPVLIPIISDGQTQNATEIFKLQKASQSCDESRSSEVKPKKTAVLRYIWLPLFGAAAAWLGYMLFKELFYELRDIIYFTVIMSEIILVWLLIIKITAVFSTGAAIDAENITLNYNRGFRFHCVTAKREHIVKTSLRQSLLGRLTDTADLTVCLTGSHSRKHILYGIPLDKAQNICYNVTVSGKRPNGLQ